MNKLSFETNGNRRRALLRRKMAELNGSSDRDLLLVEATPDELDQIQMNSDRELAVQRLDTKARTYQQIREALRKLEEGGYGICEDCQEPISPRRLDAVPWAPLCVACQTEAEQIEREAEPGFDLAA